MMKKLLSKLLAISGMLGSVAACNANWNSSYFTSTNHDVVPVAMAEDSSGNVYVLGTVQTTDTQFVIQKINSSGTSVSDVEFGSSTLADTAYDITIKSDKIYMLGREGNKMYVACFNTSLSNVWTQNNLTPVAGNNTTTSDFIPYRVSVDSGLCYVTAAVQETSSGNVDLGVSTTAKAVFYAQLSNSGSVNYSSGWEGVSGQPDNLYGTHAVSNGLVFITDTKSLISGSYYSRAHFTKVASGSNTVQWSSEVGFSGSYTNRIHKLSKSDAYGDNVFVGFENSTYVPWQTDTYTQEWITRVDGSATTAPSWTYSLSNVEKVLHGTPDKPNQHNHSGGVGRYSGDYVSCGWGDYSDVFNDDAASWLRGESGGTYNLASTNTLTIQPSVSQRAFHSDNAYLAALYRASTSSSFYYWSTGMTAGATKTIASDFASGYSGAPVHIFASGQSSHAYVVITLTDNSGRKKTGLYQLS